MQILFFSLILTGVFYSAPTSAEVSDMEKEILRELGQIRSLGEKSWKQSLRKIKLELSKLEENKKAPFKFSK